MCFLFCFVLVVVKVSYLELLKNLQALVLFEVSIE